MNGGITYAKMKKELLTGYEKGDFYISSPIRSVLGKGIFKRVSGEYGNLSERVKDTLKDARKNGIENPVAVGAIPFDLKKEPRLLVPETAFFSEPYGAKGDAADCGLLTYDVESIPAPEGYMEIVASGIDSIKNGVLVRSSEGTFQWEEYTYDANERVTLSERNGGRTVYTYDSEGYLIEEVEEETENGVTTYSTTNYIVIEK